MIVRHRPAVRRVLGGDGFVAYRLHCTCGRVGEAHPIRSLAKRDLDRHISALPPVPAEQRCLTPRIHDRREWEPCEVCEKQLPLFDLEEEGLR